MSKSLMTRLAAALTLAFAVGACDGVDAISTPQFQVLPDTFLFPKLSAGQSELRVVTITNEGSGDLIIVDIALNDRSSGGEFELFQIGDGDSLDPVPADARLVLAPGAEQQLAVRYTPTDEANDAGDVTLSTNDPDAQAVTIAIDTAEAAGEIDVNPRSIDFGGVEVGDTVTRDLTITNRGVFDLVITRFEINGRAGFDIRQDGESIAGRLAQPIVIGSEASVVLEAAYSPSGIGVADGTLEIESNAVNGQITTVNLYANGAVPCIDVRPSSVDFGAGRIVDSREDETVNLEAMVIESCGTTPLRIDRIEFEDPEGVFGAVGLPEVAEGDPLFNLPAFVNGEPPPSAAFQAGFWPLDLRVYGGRMLIYSNATPADEPTVVDLFGRGVDNECPLPLATEDVLEVQPLDIVTLDGSPSDDPDGEVTRWRWTVIQRPDGSVSEPLEAFDDPRRPADGGTADDTATPRASFFVDLAGEYVVELRVVDALGQESCEPNAAATVIIRAVPEKDLHVQLVWSTPDDPDETDTSGTDVDLHLAHERANGRWGAAAEQWDCYFRNAQPDWGAVGQVTDNPTLDIDDTNGAGPENINLAEPEIGVSYDVGAIYFRSTSTFGDPEVDRLREHPSYVTVRIFNRGTPLVELVGKELTSGFELWHVARVTWCEGDGCPQVDIIDELYAEGEYNLP